MNARKVKVARPPIPDSLPMSQATIHHPFAFDGIAYRTIELCHADMRARGIEPLPKSHAERIEP